MKASPEDQRVLLELQGLDTRIDQLAHRAETMPERAELAAAERTAADLSNVIATLDAEAGDLAVEVRRVEGEVELARGRMERDRRLLESGAITSGRQLEELQHEIASLTRRIGELEDGQLELMERAELAATRLSAVRGRFDAKSARCRELRALVAERSTDLGRERAEAEEDRGRVAEALPADLVGLYEKVRGHQGGVGAAELRGGRCGGCHLQLPPTEEQRIRSAPADDVVRCDECRRILVRETS